MSRITSVQDIKRLGTIMSVWAHPDDESFLAAGVLAAAVQNGQTTICVTATRGEEGIQNPSKWTVEGLSKVRSAELEKALKILGIHEHHWLNYPDGHCRNVPTAEAVKKLQTLIKRLRPDSILTFGRDGWTGHPDHQTVYKWVKQAVKDSAADIPVYCVVATPRHYAHYLKPLDDALDVFFNIDKPPLVDARECDIYFEMPISIRRIKCDALEASPSQTEALFENFDREFVRQAFAIECFIKY